MSIHDRLTCGWFIGLVLAFSLLAVFVCSGIAELSRTENRSKDIVVPIVLILSSVTGACFFGALIVSTALRSHYSRFPVHDFEADMPE